VRGAFVGLSLDGPDGEFTLARAHPACPLVSYPYRCRVVVGVLFAYHSARRFDDG
jgi:hypothetical protein